MLLSRTASQTLCAGHHSQFRSSKKSLFQVPYIGLYGGAGAQYSYWGGGGGGVMVNGEGPEKSYYGRGQVRALNCCSF